MRTHRVGSYKRMRVKFGGRRRSDPMYPSAEPETIFGNMDTEALSCHLKGLERIYPLRPYCDFPKSIDCF